MQVSKIEIKELGVTVEKDHTGYTLFSREGENVVAYQCVDGVHHVIPREQPAASLDDPEAAVDLIVSALGDSHPKAKALVGKALWLDR